MKNTTVCFIGHSLSNFTPGCDECRPEFKLLKNKLCAAIESAILKGSRKFITGMSLGFATWAAEEVLKLKKKYPHITLECAIPYEAQAEKWSEEDRERYFSIIERCDKETLISTKYTPTATQKLDRYMVNNSSLLIITYKYRSNGTKYILNYAQKKDIKVTIL